MHLNYIDIHSHLNLSPLLENREVILEKMKQQGVGTITVGTGLETSKMAVQIAETNPDVCWATVGFHPCDGHLPSGQDDWDVLEMLANHPKVVAIGETGLDYFHENTTESKKNQEGVFKKHIELAIKINKPVMLHVRASKGSDDAYYDALEILSKYSLGLAEPRPLPLKEGDIQSRVFANFHFFSGSKQCMLDIIAAGFTVSVDGPITFVSEDDQGRSIG
jgi:TatD DNase family protein